MDISITERDIEKISQYFRCDFSDEGRRKALLCTESMDVQACPGSGKTTLLVAKLAILSEKWQSKDQGICVLSHTNVAREEIEKRLSNHPTGTSLLYYPHFVGTIQRFVDMFFSLPSLRNRGIEDIVVDDDKFKRRAHSLCKPYDSHIWTFKKHKNGLEAIEKLSFTGAELKITSPGRNLPGETTETYKKLSVLKKRISKEGLFRFCDMYALSQDYIKKHPLIINSVRYRFPWVLIDEMQDTDRTQKQIIQNLFSEGCILQRFGDTNQAIFNIDWDDDNDGSFPMDTAIDLPKSKRFNKSIADFASYFTAAYYQNLVGDNTKPYKDGYFLLFDDRTINEVFREYANIIKEQYKTIPDNFSAIAVGARKSRSESIETELKHTPYCISSYWDAFQPEYTSKEYVSGKFIGVIYLARQWLYKTNELFGAYNILLEGILYFLRLSDARDMRGNKFTKNKMMDYFIEQNNDNYSLFSNFLRESLFRTNIFTEKIWNEHLVSFVKIVKHLIMEKEASYKYLEYEDLYNKGKLTEKDRTNIFVHEDISIKVATIHSVKGETHTCALVLETFENKVHDLKKTIECVSKKQKPIDSTIKKKMRILYVGMTRPMEMLCFAMRKDHLPDSYKKELDRAGWKIIDLTHKI